MSRRSKLLFLLLVITQAAHSLEEYLTRLFEVFPPARLVSGLISDDLAIGFALVNSVIIVGGVWCYVGPVRTGGGAGRVVASVWTVIELANGIGHVAMAIFAGGYFPGVVTGVGLIIVAACLAFELPRGT
jgi:hypothetical protein